MLGMVIRGPLVDVLRSQLVAARAELSSRRGPKQADRLGTPSSPASAAA